MDLAKDFKMKGIYDEHDPDDTKEKQAEEDNVVHDSTGDLQEYTQYGKQKIQEEDNVYTNLSEDVLDPRTQNLFMIVFPFRQVLFKKI